MKKLLYIFLIALAIQGFMMQSALADDNCCVHYEPVDINGTTYYLCTNTGHIECDASGQNCTCVD